MPANGPLAPTDKVALRTDSITPASLIVRAASRSPQLLKSR